MLLALALAASSLPLRAAEEKPDRQALAASLLFPGLGQLREKQILKAALFASAEAACLVLVALHAHRGQAAYRNYREAGSVEAAVLWRRETERHDRRRNAAIAAAAGVWALNLADILRTVKKRTGRRRALAFHPVADPESHAYGVGVSCRW